jgi:hypothetical protein
MFDWIKEQARTVGQNLGLIPLVSPYASPYDVRVAQANKVTPIPQPTPTPTPTPGGVWTAPDKPAYDPNFKFDVAPYMVNNDRWKARFGNTDPNEYIQSHMQPSQQQMIRQYFPTDATRSAITRLTEDRLNDTPPNYDQNANGTVDSGAYMNNSGTFADMMTRPVMAKRIANRGIKSFADLKNNVELSTRMAQLTAKPNPYDSTPNKWGGYSPPVPDYYVTNPKTGKKELRSGFLGVNKIAPWFGPNDAGFDLSKQLPYH